MRKTVLTMLLVASLTGCQSWFSNIRVVDVQQGNILTPELVNQLHVGMSEDQVVDLMGSPVIHDTFNSNRWDYLYYLDKAHGSQSEQLLSLYFDAKTRRIIRIEQHHYSDF